MSYFILFWKSFTIGRKHKIYEQEKKTAIAEHENLGHKITLLQKFRRLRYRIEKFIIKVLTCCCPKGSRARKLAVETFTGGTFPNFVLKSIFGFIFGFFLTYLIFVFSVFLLGLSLTFATLFCSVLGPILTVGVAFSEAVRCIVFLTIPFICSKRGRQALVAFAYALTLSGPVKNQAYNMGVLSDSLACQQEQLKKVIRNIIDAIKKPFIALKNAFKKLMTYLKEVGKKIKDTLLAIKRMIMSIVRIIAKVFKWLFSIINMCNKEVGTPFQRCSKVFEESIADCQAKLGPWFSWVCSIVYVVKMLCYIVKIFDYICMLIDFIKDNIVDPIKNKIREFVQAVKTTFYVSVRFHHKFSWHSNSSKSLKDVAKGIVNELHDRSKFFLQVCGWMGCSTIAMFIMLIIKVLAYKHRYMIDDRFDNKYINKYFRDIDMQRALHDRETLLPLTRREKKKYIAATTIFLLENEAKRLRKNLSMLFSASLKISYMLASDYILWWLLALVKFYGTEETISVSSLPSVGIKVQGDNMIAKIIRAIILAIKKILPIPNTSFELCLPEPAPPNLSKYIQIGMALGTAWVVVFVEPYGLRLRQHVMGMYHGDRARQRSVWLYNKVLSARGRFMKIARRTLRREYSLKEEIKSFKDWLVEVIPWGWLRVCLGLRTSPYCFLCGVKELSSLSDSTLIRCPTPKCIGIYCFSCYNDLGNLCTICRNPIEYGDVSDISEEKDSSEEETDLQQVIVKKTKSKKKKKTKAKSNTEAEIQPLIASSEEDFDEAENYDEVIAKSKYYDEEDDVEEKYVDYKAKSKKKTKSETNTKRKAAKSTGKIKSEDKFKPLKYSSTDDSDEINDYHLHEDKSKYYHKEDDDEYQIRNVEVRTMILSDGRQRKTTPKLTRSLVSRSLESIDLECAPKGDTFYGTDLELFDSPSRSSYQKLIPEDRIIREDGLDFSYQYCQNIHKRREMKFENDAKVMEAIERKNALKKSVVTPYTYVPKRIKDYASLQDFIEYDDFNQIIRSTPTQTNITVKEIENLSDYITKSLSTHTASTSAAHEDRLL